MFWATARERAVGTEKKVTKQNKKKKEKKSMSKIKKVLAVFLTLAMVLGMGVTTFAADETTEVNATVSGIRQDLGDAIVTAYKIVKLDIICL